MIMPLYFVPAVILLITYGQIVNFVSFIEQRENYLSRVCQINFHPTRLHYIGAVL